MANKEQLEILKKGVKVWNEWRREKQPVSIDLTGADFRRADLTRANLALANLSTAFLQGAKLSLANLNNASFYGTNLSECRLDGASLIGARFSGAYLRNAVLAGAVLRKATLNAANLQGAVLVGADLRFTILTDANLSGTNLTHTRFDGALLGGTVFGDVILSAAHGLENVKHRFPSIISSTTMHLSKGNVPVDFLHGCGLTDWEVEQVRLFNPELSDEVISSILYKVHDLRATQALQVSPLFISYSHADDEFVKKIGKRLGIAGIRYWRDNDHMKAGRIEKQIDRAIRLNPRVLLVLSENSLKSDWVEHEVRKARELEKELAREILCPVRLDDSWDNSRWPERLIEQIREYHVIDFSDWQDDSAFETKFNDLILGLKLFYEE